MEILNNINNFLASETPEDWLNIAAQNRSLLLIDHAHCEKKAASTALSFIFRYPNQHHLIQPMSRFAREELRHFEKVVALMRKEGIEYKHLTPSRYANRLRQRAKTSEPDKLVDMLIIGAFIEARSCERFSKLVNVFDGELANFYNGLLMAEARHFQVYLDLAKKISPGDIKHRLDYFAEIEAELITSHDTEFRFHSGITVSNNAFSGH